MTPDHDEISKELDKSILHQLKNGTVVVNKAGEAITVDPPAQLLAVAIKRLQQVGAIKKTENTDPISDEMRSRMRLVGRQRKTG